MLDDSDLDFAVLAAPTGDGSPAGCIVSILSLVIIIGIAIAVSNNKDDCSKRKCPPGQDPKLLAHECLCVGKAAAP